MTDYLRVRDTDSVVVGIGSPARIAISGETVYPVDNTISLDTERILRGATVTVANGEITAIAYPASVDRSVEKMIGRVQALVEEVIDINRRIPITGQVTREAMEATESWAVHLAGAGYRVAHNSITSLDLTATVQENAIAQLENMPAATKTWNGVMKSNQTYRNGWRAFGYGNGAAIYADCLNADATPRTIDGSYSVIIPGGFPADFNPHAIQ